MLRVWGMNAAVLLFSFGFRRGCLKIRAVGIGVPVGVGGVS